MLTISNKIIKTDLVAWRDLKFLQQKGFKNLTPDREQKLRNSIIKNNFVETFYVWEDKVKGVLYCLDGYHRVQVLKKLVMDNYQIPDLLTANFVHCESKEEAAKFVLLYSSMYARIEAAGFDDFISLNKLDLKDFAMEIDLPDFDFPSIEEEDISVDVSEEQETEISDKPCVVKSGDFFRLGEHYVLCGDSTNPDDIMLLMRGKKANGVVTSPPYAEQRKQYQGVSVEQYLEWFNTVQHNVKQVLAADGSFFLNIKTHCEDGERHLYVHDLVVAMRREWGWRFTEEYCWIHQGYPGELHGRFKNQFEPIFHFSLAKASDLKFRPEHVLNELSPDHYKILEKRKGKKTKDSRKGYSAASGMGDMSNYSDLKGARPGNVIQANSGAGSEHPASYPIKLPLFFVKAFSDKNDTWLDVFGGSGTTLIACEATNRVCHTIDLEPKYVELIVRRWVKYRKQNKLPVEFEHINGDLKIDDIEGNI